MYYLYFDITTGDIIASSNEFRPDTHYIEIDAEIHKKFASAEKNFSDFFVVPTLEDRTKYALKERIKNDAEFDVDKSIHQFKKVKTVDQENVFVISQKNGWTARSVLTKEYLTFLKQSKSYITNVKEIYVTAENNPNILLDVLKLPIESVLSNKPYIFTDYNKEVAKKKNISLYCGTIFENFVHEVNY